MIILSIDPGYERLGTAVLEKTTGRERLLYSHCFTTSRTQSHADRLNLVGAEVERIIEHYHPTVLAIETLFFSKNQKTALLVAEARGVILYAAKKHGLAVYEFQPSEIKIAVTGHGNSDKKQMMAMIPRLIDMKNASTPHTGPKHDDEYDAIAAGITFFAIHGSIIHNKKQ
jgi:crossover junction endodeoxyribonuclease RuvC